MNRLAILISILGLVASPAFVAAAQLFEDLLSKTNLSSPVRIQMRTHFDSTIQFKTLETDASGAASFVSHQSGHENQSQITFCTDGLYSRYNLMMVDPSGRLVPRHQRIVPTVTVQAATGIWDLPLSEALQLDLFRWIKPDSIEPLGPGKFTARSMNGEQVSIDYDEEKRLVREVRIGPEPSPNEVRRYLHETNVAGIWFFTLQTVDHKARGDRGQYRTELTVEGIDKAWTEADVSGPPIGAVVTDERFSPPLSYRAGNRKYTDAELNGMWNSQHRARAALPPAPMRPMPLARAPLAISPPLKFGLLAALIGLPLAAIVITNFIFRRR